MFLAHVLSRKHLDDDCILVRRMYAQWSKSCQISLLFVQFEHFEHFEHFCSTNSTTYLGSISTMTAYSFVACMHNGRKVVKSVCSLSTLSTLSTSIYSNISTWDSPLVRSPLVQIPLHKKHLDNDCILVCGMYAQ